MLKLPKVDKKETSCVISETQKIKKVFVGVALAFGISVASLPADAVPTPSSPQATQQGVPSIDQGSLLLTTPSADIQVAGHYSHRSHSSHSSHRSHYSSRY